MASIVKVLQYQMGEKILPFFRRHLITEDRRIIENCYCLEPHDDFQGAWQCRNICCDVKRTAQQGDLAV